MSQPRLLAFTLDELSRERWRRFRDTSIYVSDLGRARSTAWGRLCALRPFPNTAGYLQLNWRTGDGRGGASRTRHVALLHRMILEAFCGPCPGGNPRAVHGCHYDGDRRNNRLSNLRWATAAENSSDNRRLGRGPQKLSARDATEVNRRLLAGETHRAIAKDYGVSSVAITAISTGKAWGHVTGRCATDASASARVRDAAEKAQRAREAAVALRRALSAGVETG